MPSQAINGNNNNTPASTMNSNARSFVPSSMVSTSSNSNNTTNPSQRRKPQQRRGRKKASPAPTTEKQSKGEESSPANAAHNQQATAKKPSQRKNRKGGAKETATQNGENASTNNQQNSNKKQHNANKKNSKKKQRNNKKKFPWRKFIPQGTVDPITLDSLDSLSYPPFALDANPPYQLIPEWPIPQDDQQRAKQEDPEERQRQIMQQQWGDILPSKEADDSVATPKVLHVNLFDGRALAYYMVSQLQFIDPLNRRDVTRDELLLLDQYLKRHGFTHMKVVEAYDAKGISISTAGAASRTSEGRVQLLQQEAQQLLNALFGGHSLSPSSSLQMQYQNHETATTTTARNHAFNATIPDHLLDTTAVYGDEGLMIIDDNENPDLRGANLSSQDFSNQMATASAAQQNPEPTWYGSRYRSNGVISATEENFPALSTPSRTAAAAAGSTTNGKQMSKSLQKISASVKKVSQEELQRQWEAREEARRRAAMMSHLTFQQGGGGSGVPQQVMTLGTPLPVEPSPGQLERNQAFAQALGVNKSTTMTTTGWSRPTEQAHTTVVYPQTLLEQAKEQMGLVIKLERKWMTFLSNPKEPSLPLNYMDRSARKLTHEYAAFWKMTTESFDPEPKRYVHCRKLLDTSAPFPLLSDVARHWRPSQETIITTTQTAGQITKEAPERPKLELLKRSLPLELPPYQPTSTTTDHTEFDITEQMRQQQAKRQEKAQKEQEKNHRRMKMLEAAFASDDEDDGCDHSAASSSEWSEKEELYPGDVS